LFNWVRVNVSQFEKQRGRGSRVKVQDAKSGRRSLKRTGKGEPLVHDHWGGRGGGERFDQKRQHLLGRRAGKVNHKRRYLQRPRLGIEGGDKSRIERERGEVHWQSNKKETAGEKDYVTGELVGKCGWNGQWILRKNPAEKGKKIVVARKLLDDLRQGMERPKETPRLKKKKGQAPRLYGSKHDRFITKVSDSVRTKCKVPRLLEPNKRGAVRKKEIVASV